MNPGYLSSLPLRPLVFCAAVLPVCNGCMPAAPAPAHCRRTPPRHVVIVMEENHSYSSIIGNPDAPYMNLLAQEGASLTESHGVTHPSQPNYIALFSGSTQGVTDNAAHPHDEFTAPNLASKLLAAGYTFVGFADGLPESGFDGVGAGDSAVGLYQRKHCPWINWQDATEPPPENKLPPTISLPFTSFPTDFNDLPTLAMVVPNQKHDMHDGTIAEADSWLEQYIGPYVEWARSHDSLLILTWDEDDSAHENHVVTVFHGPGVQPGEYAGFIDHYNVLATLEAIYDLPHDAKTAEVDPITCEIWRPAD
jgi:hypothetical protein